MRQQQDEPGRFSICSRQAAVVLRAYIFCGACGNNRTNRGGFQFAAARLPWFRLSASWRKGGLYLVVR
ncbi:hypothetical protein C3D39_23220 [Escherichia coli O51]|nr:hypothetical protein [Escherichia coli O51]